MRTDAAAWTRGYRLPCDDATFDRVRDAVVELLDADTALSFDEVHAALVDAADRDAVLADYSRAESRFIAEKALTELAADDVVEARTIEAVSGSTRYYCYVDEFDRDPVPY